MLVGMANSEEPELTTNGPAPPERPPPFEHPLLKPMSPEDRIPEGDSTLTLIPKR
jgi:hypothetical protein